MRPLMAFAFLAMSSLAYAESLPTFICSQVELDGVNRAITVGITIPDTQERPMTALVDGLPNAAGVLRMNFQDVLGLGKNPDGAVIYSEPGTGDGTIQDVCGAKANFLIFDARPNVQVQYCAVCVKNPLVKF